MICDLSASKIRNHTNSTKIYSLDVIINGAISKQHVPAPKNVPTFGHFLPTLLRNIQARTKEGNSINPDKNMLMKTLPGRMLTPSDRP